MQNHKSATLSVILFLNEKKEEEKHYEEEAYKMWGESVRESHRKWNSYNKAKKDEILQQGKEIYNHIVEKMYTGPDSPQIQQLMQQWHHHLRNFYEPSYETLRDLGELYCQHPEFQENIASLHPDLPVFLKHAISVYVDGLEKQENPDRNL